ncbi:hypothetical protein [Pseudomonas putida]|uniref:hypothetical protein n=1 Tax=Pseudomonas putida TaxID=303 RepID=UPI003466DDF6
MQSGAAGNHFIRIERRGFESQLWLLDFTADSRVVGDLSGLHLAMAKQYGEPALMVVTRALTQIAAFEAEGGQKTLDDQLDAEGQLIKRIRGK